MVLISTNLYADTMKSSTRCFTSTNGKTNVKFVEIYNANDKINIAYVKYEKSDKSIPLYLITRETESTDNDRPVATTKKWLEIIDGKPNGEYTIMSQGAQIYTFTYTRKNGTPVNFNYNTEATSDDYLNCSWKTQTPQKIPQ